MTVLTVQILRWPLTIADQKAKDCTSLIFCIARESRHYLSNFLQIFYGNWGGVVAKALRY
jgi:hypothetical protein